MSSSDNKADRDDVEAPPRELMRSSARLLARHDPTLSEALARSRSSQLRRVDWERLWLSVQQRPWRVLALVPAGDGAPEDFTLDIAAALVRTGMTHLGVPIRIADATDIPLAQLVQFMNEVRSAIQCGDLVLLALGPVTKSSTAVALAQAADGAILCVPLGRVKTAEARATLDQIGPAEFVGSVAFHV